VFHRYPASSDEFGWLKQATTVTAAELAALLEVVRSARSAGEAKEVQPTRLAQRRLSLVGLRDDDDDTLVDALAAHKTMQDRERLEAGRAWRDNNLVFCREDGSMYNAEALNWRFSKMTRKAGIGHWHAHEGRHTAVSIMSSNGVPIQEISDTVGHKSTHVTETVYRHVIVPAIRGGATVMDSVFGDENEESV
jgi:integrase